MAAHAIVTSFLVSFFVFYLIIYTPKGSVNKDLLGLLDRVLEQDFWIILSGLGFITVENMGQIMLEKSKDKVAGNVAVGSPSTENINVKNMQVKQNISTDDPILEAPIEDGPSIKIFESNKPE